MSKTNNEGPAVDHAGRMADGLPEWARGIVSDAETRFTRELSELTRRVQAFQASQMADFTVFAARLVDEMCMEIKRQASRNGYDYLSAMKAEREVRAKFGTALDRLKS